MKTILCHGIKLLDSYIFPTITRISNKFVIKLSQRVPYFAYVVIEVVFLNGFSQNLAYLSLELLDFVVKAVFDYMENQAKNRGKLAAEL